MHEWLGSELLWRVAAVSGGLVALRCTCKGANELLSDAAVAAAVLAVMPELTWLGGGGLRELLFAAASHVGAPPPPARCSRSCMRPVLSTLTSGAAFNS